MRISKFPDIHGSIDKLVLDEVIKYLQDAICDPQKTTINCEDLLGNLEYYTQLPERLAALEDKLAQIEGQRSDLEKGNIVLNALMELIPLQIIVLDPLTNEIMLMNDVMKAEIAKDPDYVKNFVDVLNVTDKTENVKSIELHKDGNVRYLEISELDYPVLESKAKVYILNDISEAKIKMKALEVDAFTDALTGLYNRAYGMNVLHKLMCCGSQFCLIFCDLDYLKYINDVYGHKEGDIYIKNAAKHLLTMPEKSVVCRLGGDEFMVVISDENYESAEKYMEVTHKNLSEDPYVIDKEYNYSISYGVVEVPRGAKTEISEILSVADERMYAFKRKKKAQRAR